MPSSAKSGADAPPPAKNQVPKPVPQKPGEAKPSGLIKPGGVPVRILAFGSGVGLHPRSRRCGRPPTTATFKAPQAMIEVHGSLSRDGPGGHVNPFIRSKRTPAESLSEREDVTAW